MTINTNTTNKPTRDSKEIAIISFPYRIVILLIIGQGIKAVKDLLTIQVERGLAESADFFGHTGPSSNLDGPVGFGVSLLAFT
jgi:hypothetical protein